ncbi:MAG: hypothetical protein KatS3mg108_3148 [Isosphaeraceae bacterium]|nr:MAG: hypothetical protein KatS3mg108_3148 [Isosphaeraceae bacterium]
MTSDPQSSPPTRLREIPTNWTEVFQASGDGPSAREAQDRLLRRYGPAILRYLLALTRDPESAAELFQNFARSFIEGGLRHANPGRGKFRSYLKTTLIHLVSSHRKSSAARAHLCLDDLPEPAQPIVPPPSESDLQFLHIWRTELLHAAFDELQELEQRKNLRYHTALDLRLRHPEARSRQLAEAFTSQTGEPISESQFRRLLHLARREFEDRLLRIVQDTLDHPSLDELEEELIEVGLHTYCKPALDRRRQAWA